MPRPNESVAETFALPPKDSYALVSAQISVCAF